LEGLGIENVGICILSPFGLFYGHFYGRLVYFVVIWYIFSRIGMFGPRKIWQPWYAGFCRILSKSIRKANFPLVAVLVGEK
jgi:hypothetical protein